LKVALLNTFDTEGGAAMATYRLHRGLVEAGVDSTLIVQTKHSDDPSVSGPRSNRQKYINQVRPAADRMLNLAYRSRGKAMFSPAWLPDGVVKKVESVAPDVLHLFWVTGGFMKIESVGRMTHPIVWTLHDMWPFTGGCHYDDGCGRFQQKCGLCPLLGSRHGYDLSRLTIRRKLRSWADVPITVVATSRWLAEMARSSSVFSDKRIEVIPNGLDLDKYKPIDKTVARQIWGLPQDKRLVLFSSFGVTSDKRKGNQYLVPAIRKLVAEGGAKDLELVVVGASYPASMPDLGVKVHCMGRLQDEISQVLLYSAADATVAPSVQENLSNTVMESLACGTPVVAFDIGGMPDLIEHRISGYLAVPFEHEDLANGIAWVLESESRHKQLAESARSSVERKYALDTVAGQYLSLYRSVTQ